MLTDLCIRNFAIIDELRIPFGVGLNILSGETGAGKSIIIGAVNLLLGERASTDIIRTAEETASVEAVFDLTGYSQLLDKFAGMGLVMETELVIRRVVARSGKNRVFVNGQVATLSMLTAVTEALINICGQHEHQKILDANHHLEILDAYAGLEPERSAYRELFENYQECLTEIRLLEEKNRQRAERQEYLAFQQAEIAGAAVLPDEDQRLLEERKVLIHAQRLRELAGQSHETLYGREGSILEELRCVLVQLREIKKIDDSCEVSPDLLEGYYFQLEEAALALRRYETRIALNPERLLQLDERLEVLGRLKRKYGGTLAGVLNRQEEVAAELTGLSLSHQNLAVAMERREALLKELDRQATGLSQRRQEAAKKLQAAVESEIRSLRMPQAVFEVIFKPQPPEPSERFTPRGSDQVEFYLSTNVGEDLKPLNRVASGGELSRILLAMKKIVAHVESLSTIIFDEVDSGIGGATAEIVGKKLRDISRYQQVLCITHLPQIASYADRHYQVAKQISGDRTQTQVNCLSEEGRVEEIARMLGGVQVTEKTRAHALEMIRASRADKVETC